MNGVIISSLGKIIWKDKEYRCAIGKSGVRKNKIEGDGATPEGCFRLRKILFRKDRTVDIKTQLPKTELHPTDGWCDDQKDKNYNKLVTLPYPTSAESLWREDHIYDVIVILGYNDEPVVPGKGSAIFMHVAREDYAPTNGCIALSLPDLLEIFKSATSETLVCIQA